MNTRELNEVGRRVISSGKDLTNVRNHDPRIFNFPHHKLKVRDDNAVCINTLYLTETAKIPRARLSCRSSRMSRTSCLALDSTKGLLMHSNSLQSSPKSMPSTILSASDLSAVASGDASVLLDSFATATKIYGHSEFIISSN